MGAASADTKNRGFTFGTGVRDECANFKDAAGWGGRSSICYDCLSAKRVGLWTTTVLLRSAPSSKFANRIVHMASLSSPNKMPSMLNVRQIRHIPGIAVETAAECTGFLDEGFREMNLPIRVTDAAVRAAVQTAGIRRHGVER